MKVSFIADFREKDNQHYISETKLNDAFLVFLPKRIEILPERASKRAYSGFSSGNYFEIKMETSELYTIEDIQKMLEKFGIRMEKVSSVRREFTPEELEKIKNMVCFKQIFEPSEVKKNGS